jgi:dTDP-glucose pyrophosphorylase
VWGVIPAAGRGSRIQPLAFSKELLPVGCRIDGGVERPCAVAEYLVERMILGGATKICFVISPGKSDIVEYFGAGYQGCAFAYVVQPQPTGLCDAIFRALPVVPESEPVLVGLPDTVWFPEQALQALPDDRLSFLLFPVERPEYFDAVVTGESGEVLEIQVKHVEPATKWVWGAFKMPGATLAALEALWRQRDRRDEYIGTLVNAFIERGGEAFGVAAGRAYVDVGTLDGYRTATRVLEAERAALETKVKLDWPAGRRRPEGEEARP